MTTNLTSYKFNYHVDNIPEEYLSCETIIFEHFKFLPLNLNECVNLKHLIVKYSFFNECKEVCTYPTVMSNLISIEFYKCVDVVNFLCCINNAEKLESMKINKCELTEVPNVSMLNNLIEIDLSENKITNIPRYVNNFVAKQLILDYNQITSFTNHPLNVEHLSLNFNEITDIDIDAPELFVLELTYNQLTTFPNLICPKLLFLSIYGSFENDFDFSVENLSVRNIQFGDVELPTRLKPFIHDCNLNSTEHPNRYVQEYLNGVRECTNADCHVCN